MQRRSGIEPQTSNAVRHGRKVALENLFSLTQRQSQRRESSRICCSANVFDNLSPPASEVQLWFSSKTSPLCIFIYLTFKGFCSCQKNKRGAGVFFGATLMRPSLRFHGDSHKTVKFPVFQKKKKEPCRVVVVVVVVVVGVFFNCQRQLFKEHVILLGRWNLLSCFFFPEFSQFASSFFFLSQQPLWLHRRIPVRRLNTRKHTSISVASNSFSYFRSSLKCQKIRNLQKYLLTSLLEVRWNPPPQGLQNRIVTRETITTHPLTS